MSVKTTVILDAESAGIVNQLPRGFSLSEFIRNQIKTELVKIVQQLEE